MSAKTGAGFDALLEVLDQQGHFGRRILDLDYDVYAEGEAELGWLNSSLRVTAPAPFSLDDLCLNIVQRSAAIAGGQRRRTGTPEDDRHVGGSHAVANLVSSDTPAVLSLASDCHTRQRRPDRQRARGRRSAGPGRTCPGGRTRVRAGAAGALRSSCRRRASVPVVPIPPAATRMLSDGDPGESTMRLPAWFVGELLGTFLLVFFGCGVVCTSVARVLRRCVLPFMICLAAASALPSIVPVPVLPVAPAS